MRNLILLAAAAACAILARPAQAGFLLTTDANLVDILENAPIDAVFQVGEGIRTASVPPRGFASGTFSAYAPDSPADTVLGPLSQYGYQLNLSVTGTSPTETMLGGTYAIEQFLTGGAMRNVSSGTADLTLMGTLMSGGPLTGTLFQTAGPDAGAPDITYGGAFDFNGAFAPILLTPGQEIGIIQGSLSPRPIPEPGTLALLGAGALPLLGLIRRRK